MGLQPRGRGGRDYMPADLVGIVRILFETMFDRNSSKWYLGRHILRRGRHPRGGGVQIRLPDKISDLFTTQTRFEVL